MASAEGGGEQPNTIQQPESLAKSIVTFFRKQYQTFLDALKDFDKASEKAYKAMKDRQSKIDCDKFFQEIYDAVNTTLKERGRALDESEKEELAKLKELHKLMRESESEELKYLMRRHKWLREQNPMTKVDLPQYQLYNLYNHASNLEELLNKNEK